MSKKCLIAAVVSLTCFLCAQQVLTLCLIRIDCGDRHIVARVNLQVRNDVAGLVTVQDILMRKTQTRSVGGGKLFQQQNAGVISQQVVQKSAFPMFPLPPLAQKCQSCLCGNLLGIPAQMVFAYILEVVLSNFLPANAVQSHVGGSVLPGGSETGLSYI